MENLKLFSLLAGISLFFLSPTFGQIGNFNHGIGAGASLTSGDYNTMIGDSAGATLSSGLYNTFVGKNAGKNYNNESDNTAIGAYSAFTCTTGVDNVFVGARTGYNNSATDNTFIGNEAGQLNTSGSDNTFVGEESGQNNTTGRDNTFMGEDAGFNNIDGDDNTFIGSTAGRANKYGWRNTAVGNEALYDVGGSTTINTTEAHHNTAIGDSAGIDNGNGKYNTYVGAASGAATEHADNNTMVGAYAGWDNNRTNSTTNANRNTYLGAGAGYSNRVGEDNVGIGAFANFNNSDRSRCTFVGAGGATDNTSPAQGYPTTDMVYGNDATVFGFAAQGNQDAVAMGSKAKARTNGGISIGYMTDVRSTAGLGIGIGYKDTVTAANSIALGSRVSVTGANSIAIGFASSVSADNEVYLGNSTTASIGGVVNWTATSDQRFKNNITADVKGLDFVLKLRPVTYNMDPVAIASFYGRELPEDLKAAAEAKSKITYTGFLAQEVEAAAKEADYDFSGIDAPEKEGEAYGIRYAEFVVPLTKSVQELHQIIADQQVLLSQQENQMEGYHDLLGKLEAKLQTLEARVTEMDAQTAYSSNK